MEKKKLLYLESIRGIAAFEVLIFHLFSVLFPGGKVPNLSEGATDELPVRVLLKIIWLVDVSGTFAVNTFFVLSGFVLSVSYLSRKENVSLVPNAIKRYFRLMPLVLASTVMASVLISLGWIERPTYSNSIFEAIFEGLFGTFFRGYTNQSYNAVLWTIQIEFLGSFLVFGLIALIKNSKSRWYLYPILLLAFSNSFYVWFILGIAIADLYANNPKGIMDRIGKINPILKSLAISFPIFLAFYPNNKAYSDLSYFRYVTIFQNDLNYSRIFLHVISLTLIFLIVLTTPMLQKVLSIKPLVFLGATSFSVYVIHFVLVTGLTNDWLERAQKDYSYTIAVSMTILGMLSMIYILGYILHKTVDKYSLTLSERVAKKVMDRPQKAKIGIKQ